jgi:hypothetical protein
MRPGSRSPSLTSPPSTDVVRTRKISSDLGGGVSLTPRRSASSGAEVGERRDHGRAGAGTTVGERHSHG